jgi:hypothetical protein
VGFEIPPPFHIILNARANDQQLISSEKLQRAIDAIWGNDFVSLGLIYVLDVFSTGHLLRRTGLIDPLRNSMSNINFSVYVVHVLIQCWSGLNAS